MSKVVKFPPWDTIVNDTFLPLIDNEDRYLILYGGRGSSKSVFTAQKLIKHCLEYKYFRCVMTRKDKATVRLSCYQTLKDIIEAMGLKEVFTFYDSRMEIRCFNGNRFLAGSWDEPAKIKSLMNPTHVWYEEDIPAEDDFITITTSIRTKLGDNLQEIFSINPEVDGDYQEHWFFKRFFKNHYPSEMSFRGHTELQWINPVTKKKEYAKNHYTVHHSTHEDNVWVDAQFADLLESLKEQNPYYYQVYGKGMWGRRDVRDRYYRSFKLEKHVIPTRYDSSLPLHISFDFNVNPYVSIGIYQVKNREIRIIDEIAAKDPNNIRYHRKWIFRYDSRIQRIHEK